jgi:KAP family P-loop domain
MSIADISVTDRPLGTGASHGPAHARDVAVALARFLRSSATQRPLTIAISGDWASGKSSALAILERELRADGLPVVLFNAFQAQTERDLLAAVLRRIGESAAPWWRLTGLNFRGRLLLIRLARRRHLLVALIGAAAVISGYLLPNHSGSPTATVAAWVPTWQQIRDSGAGVWLALLAASPVLALLISLADLLLQGRPLAGRVTRAELRGRRDFRGRFVDDFRDLVEALKPRPLTLLIDDLDRCSPKAVVNVLEAVNTLVNAGDCFVVIGMDRPSVERSMQLHLTTLGQLSQRQMRAHHADDASVSKTRDMSARYLRKLIGVEVALPAPGAQAGLVTTLPAMDIRRRWTPVVWRVGVLAALILSGVVIGDRYRLATASAFSVGALPVSWFVAGWFGCLAVLGLVPAVYVVARLFEPGAIVEDAKDWREALETWAPVIAGYDPSPRAIKQFVVQMRLLAYLGAERIPSSTSVALLALHRLDKGLIEGGDLDRRLSDYLATRDQALRTSVIEAATRHGQRFAWPPSPEDVEQFRRSVALIRTDEPGAHFQL